MRLSSSLTISSVTSMIATSMRLLASHTVMVDGDDGSNLLVVAVAVVTLAAERYLFGNSYLHSPMNASTFL